MLLYLKVKNLALIDSAEVEFGPGLNILTGETGAGKSVIIGSVSLALGARAQKEMIRRGAESTYIELVFSVDSEEKKKELAEHDIYPDEDGLILVTRKITPQKSISRVNDEAVTRGRLTEITGLLLDIHGQHDHQSLIYPKKHLEILDAYGKSFIGPHKEEVRRLYREYTARKKEADRFLSGGEERIREMDFLRFEVEEIEAAALKPGEEEELAALCRRMRNAERINGGLSEAYEAVNQDILSRAVRAMEKVLEYDEGLSDIYRTLADMDSLAEDVKGAIQNYLEDASFDEEEYLRAQERLDRIRLLEQKYGRTVEEVGEALARKKERLSELENYDTLKEKAEKELRLSRNALEEASEKLSRARRETAGGLLEKIREHLLDLNFLDVQFTMEFGELSGFTDNGRDSAEFLISVNPGEAPRPLKDVASGGELSRIMLAIKTVLAETDDIPTLIFDEIDTGISGRTAQKVAEKLGLIAVRHQVIAITHLPQIAAMADSHFGIIKDVKDGRTETTIHRLSGEETVEELARILGGAELTDAVRENAEEMKRLADRRKEEYRK